MKRRADVVLAVGAVAFSATLVGCSGGDGDKKAGGVAFSRDGADSVLDLTASKFSYVGLPPAVKGPKVFFQLRNDDPMTQHELQVITPDGKSMGGIPPFVPGETKSVALELPPGNYLVRCMVRAVDTPHADMGMKNFLRVE